MSCNHIQLHRFAERLIHKDSSLKHDTILFLQKTGCFYGSKTSVETGGPLVAALYLVFLEGQILVMRREVGLQGERETRVPFSTVALPKNEGGKTPPLPFHKVQLAQPVLSENKEEKQLINVSCLRPSFEEEPKP